MALDIIDISLVPIPEPSELTFSDGINHPALWLWDSWTCRIDNILHLYCLALARETNIGSPINPEDRNAHPFHIRHFVSADEGQNWHDKGCFFMPSDHLSFMSRNVWSGCMTPLSDGRILFGFTGIEEMGPNRNFLQSIAIGISDGMSVSSIQSDPLSHALLNYEEIMGAGYYLGPKENLGANEGEGGGPILAWRDPYFIEMKNGIEAFWAAKASPSEGAIAHATLKETDNGFVIDTLHPPITLPHSDKTTQAEVPKIYGTHGDWFMLISASDRLYEGQPDNEVSKMLRLYRSEDLRGPWVPYHEDGSTLTINDELFGSSIVDLNVEAGTASFMSPISEMTNSGRALSFAPIETINLFEKTKQTLKL